MRTRAPAFLLPELASWSAANGAALDPTQMKRLSTYLDTLVFWGRSIDLVSQSDPAAIVSKHFADSLVPARFCSEAARIADLGSGAGFPGLVLAIALPRSFVGLVEARAKRASFLAEVVRAAHVDNAAVIHGRAEGLWDKADHERAYDVVISRALGSLRNFLSFAGPLLRPGGIALAMKGPRFAEDIDELGDRRRPEIVHPYNLPDGSARALLGFRCN